MNFLKAEIERKKRQLQEKQVVGPDKKYFKRGDLIEKERQEYFKKLKPKEEDVKALQELMASKSKAGEASGSKSSSSSNEQGKKLGNEEPDVPQLPRVEVVRRLRERLQPIFLFGESEAQACLRLRSVELNEPDDNMDDKLEGAKNDFKEAMDQVEKVLLREGSSSKSEQPEQSDLYDTKVTYEQLLDMIKDAANKVEGEKGELDADVKIVYEFIKFMMTKWAKGLDLREEDVKTSVMGKREAGIHAQTRTYLKPLLKMLKKQTLSDDVRDSLVKMIIFALQKDYILSHEAYMEMAVGNAPWPIGVTNAGIHARPARENIFSKNVAHVLNDETQRKYIQGLKRLITKAQDYYPTDPSKSVDFVKKD